MKTTPERLACFAACMFVSGCGGAPAINIIGSFFPAWMICLTTGVILAFASRTVLIHYRLETEIGSPALFYPCVVILMTCLLWLIFFR